MKKKITIAIDAMGGDNSPSKTVKGVGLFLLKNNLHIHQNLPHKLNLKRIAL